jgi:hypothetical protein
MNEIQARNLFEKIALTNTGCMDSNSHYDTYHLKW